MKPPDEKRDSQPAVGAILCADWGMGTGKRTVYVADVSSRVVRRIAPNIPWSVAAVVQAANSMAAKGPVLAAFDAPLGVPESYLAAVAAIPSWRSPSSFVDFLTCACHTPQFFLGTRDAFQWTIERPFFSVPAGEGGLKTYVNAAKQKGVDLYRGIDRRTGAKTVFAKSGIPGTAGSAACALWQELGPLLEGTRTFRVWPFEGELPTLLGSTAVVLGEMYPRAAYATALLEGPATSRPALIVAKTKAEIRGSAIEALRTAEWVRVQGVTMENLLEAEDNEDDFDACMTAAALLRCELERVSLYPPRLDSDRAEGGILGTGSVNLDYPARRFGVRLNRGDISDRRPAANANDRDVPHTARTFRCPIPGCDKAYANTRSGWDGHVGSPRSHPEWRPEFASAEERKRQFEIEFPDFFR